MKNTIKVFRAKSGDSGKYILSSGFTGLLPLTPLIDSEWLEMVFLSDKFNRQKDQMSEGGTMSGVKTSSLSGLYIPYFASFKKEHDCMRVWSAVKKATNLEAQKLADLTSLKEYCLSHLFA